MAIDEDPEGHEIDALAATVSFAGRRVVEIGCGEGRLTARYARAAASVIAIDPDAEAVAALAAERIPHVDARALGVEELALAPASADIVLFAWSL
jgi:16S rRNA A1518/A1519 N6-dimethyltransferase RsmA/KsgA/DIM1 with predicted DNA glycosylase/AP lyase activity